jgi:hypothetical protein
MNVIGTNDVNAGNLIFASGGSNSIIFGFNPINLPNLLGWYSSDYGVYNTPRVLATDGQTVRTWQNKLNNGINLNQDGATMAPIYSNGAIQFSQNAMSGINPYALNAPLTYYVATQTILSGGITTTSSFIIKQDSSTNNFKYKFGANTGAFLSVRSANTEITSNLKLNNGKNIIYASFSGTTTTGNAIVGINNSYETFSQIMGTNNSNVFVVGGNSVTSSNLPLKGSIYEILIYTGLHTETQKNEVITYLSNKWEVSF